MDEKLDKIQKSIDDLTEIVVAVTHRIGEVETKVDVGFEQVNGKIDGLHRRIDAELERTLQLETRVVKIEEVVGIAK